MRTLEKKPSSPGSWLVLKFGGTSVSSLKNWKTIRDLVDERTQAGFRVLVVHSALKGISNLLEQSIQEALSKDQQLALVDIIKAHSSLSSDLGLDGLDGLNEDIQILKSSLAKVNHQKRIDPPLQAEIMALGELMATRLGAAFLEAQGLDINWIDARRLLCSVKSVQKNEKISYLSAICDFSPDENLKNHLSDLSGTLITQGFIASNENGETVLLGRGGSDTSASYLAAKLKSDGIEIWTDVPGIYSANPRIVRGTRQIKILNYPEAQEIASTGGSILHPRCLAPLRQEKIPLQILCTDQPNLSGTMVSDKVHNITPGVRSISRRTGITLVSMETLGMWHKIGFLSDAFRCFSNLGLSIDLISTSETNVTVTLDKETHDIDSSKLSQLEEHLKEMCRVKILENVEIVSVVGHKIRSILHEIGPALEVFEKHKIHLLTQASNDLNLSFVVGQDQSKPLVQKLHYILVQPDLDSTVFGDTWEQLSHSNQTKPSSDLWWARKRDKLLKIVESKKSIYVYNLETIQKAIDRLRSLDSVDSIYFATKANSNPKVLQVVYEAGLNLECVSAEELEHVLKLFPDIDRKRILFTPNFAPRSEYMYALDKRVWITLDNLYPLVHWPELFKNQEILIRLDTGQAKGHHRYVRTQGLHTKFGIPLFELDEVYRRVTACGTKVVGLHAHSGSGILDSDHWGKVAAILVEASAKFSTVRYINLGGGLGVVERTGQSPLDLSIIDQSLAEAKKTSGLEIWLEPGRYLVAESGVLLTKVTQLKGKGSTRYVGVATGMNSLIRPALYGAYHEIVNLSRLDEARENVVNVVGPICETTDLLGSNRHLPECVEGDVLLVANTGAYGYVMGSHYNLRKPAEEFTL